MTEREVGPDVVDEHPAAQGPRFRWGATTHVGGVRDHNEDAFYVSDEVCVVADGMGGHEAGEVASQLVTQLVAETFGARPLAVTELPRVVSSLNSAVRQKGAENNTQGMGTTVVGVALADNADAPSAVVFHVGDSRCYRIAHGRMDQLTTDHSHVQDLVQDGRITEAEARAHPLRNVITRALGADAVVEADFHVLPEEDCRLLLCSDGLSGEVDDDRIWELLSTYADPSKAAVALVEAVLEGPARDNVTAVVIDLSFPFAHHDDRSQPTAHRGVADVTAEVESAPGAPMAEVTAEPEGAVMVDVAWAPPTPGRQRPDQGDRPSAARDAAPWGAPEPSSNVSNTQPAPHDSQ